MLLKKSLLVSFLLLHLNIIIYAQDGFLFGNPELAFWKIGTKKEIVIVLHGGPGAGHSYLRPEFDLLSNVAQVVYYDQRGCGRSKAANSYTWKTHVDDLHRVINNFAKNEKVFLIGSSWGSSLAMLYTYKYPNKVKWLILTGTYNWQGQGFDSTKYEAYRRFHKSLTTADTLNNTRVGKITFSERRLAISHLKNKHTNATVIVIKRDVEIITHGDAPMSETQMSMVTAPILDSLKTITNPVLLFKGSYKNCAIDWANHYVDILPHATLYTIKEACHDPWLSAPKEFMDRCVKFIKFVSKTH